MIHFHELFSTACVHTAHWYSSRGRSRLLYRPSIIDMISHSGAFWIEIDLFDYVSWQVQLRHLQNKEFLSFLSRKVEVEGGVAPYTDRVLSTWFHIGGLFGLKLIYLITFLDRFNFATILQNKEFLSFLFTQGRGLEELTSQQTPTSTLLLAKLKTLISFIHPLASKSRIQSTLYQTRRVQQYSYIRWRPLVGNVRANAQFFTLHPLNSWKWTFQIHPFTFLKLGLLQAIPNCT